MKFEANKEYMENLSSHLLLAILEKKKKKSKCISPRLRTAKSTNAGDIGGVNAAKALFRVDTIMETRMQ